MTDRDGLASLDFKDRLWNREVFDTILGVWDGIST